jgi:hypothetical protein
MPVALALEVPDFSRAIFDGQSRPDLWGQQ